MKETCVREWENHTIKPEDIYPRSSRKTRTHFIAEIGGAHGVRDLTMLESAIARPQATFGGKDLYSDLFTKAAALLDSLINNHPFVDGNKRTGVTAAALFLRCNGYRLKASHADVEKFTWQVAASRTVLKEIADWFLAHSVEDEGE
jgi:death on curing protein